MTDPNPNTNNVQVQVPNADGARGLVPFFGEAGLQTRATADLSKDDFANIYTAKIEDAIRRRIRECTDVYHSAQDALKAAEKAVEDHLRSLGQAARDAAEPTAKALTEWGVPSESRADTPSFNHRTNRVSFHVTVASTGGAGSITKSWTETASQDLIGLYRAYEDANDALEAAATTLAQARSALHNIASAERQAKAAVVKKVIASLEGGEDLLAQIDQNLDVDGIVENLRTI